MMNKTQRLFDENAYTKEFECTVLACIRKGGLYGVITDKTAFFPGGGGQLWDDGLLDGQPVRECEESDGVIIHYVNSPFDPGKQIKGSIDWSVRFRRMQAHTGEHIISGIAHTEYGCENVGFHMDEELLTIDFDKELTEEQIERLERLANEAVWEDLKVSTWYPNPCELERADYRSKTEIEGDVRLVSILGTDLCACCAPHVSSTGQVGLISILSFQRHRGGVRLTAQAGRAAWEYSKRVYNEAVFAGRELSVKPEEICTAVKRSLSELEKLRFEARQLGKRLALSIISGINGCEGELCLIAAGLDQEALRQSANSAMERFGCRCAVFSKNDDGSYACCIGDPAGEAGAFAKEILTPLSGRGGGRGTMASGRAAAGEDEIRAFFANRGAKIVIV